MSRAVISLLLVAIAACGNPFGPSDAARIREAESRWERHGFTSYEFEMRTSCFCPPEINEWAVVTVRDGRVTGARTLSGVPLSGFGLSSRKSVEDLFATLKAERDSWVAEVEVSFDAQFSYPRLIVLESKSNIADAGVTYETRNLKPIEEP